MTAATSSPKKAKPTQPQSNQPDTMAVLSLVFGVASLVGPGLLLGIPAIIVASVALKKDLPGRGLSIAGLVTGIISTVLSVILIALLIGLIIWGIGSSETFYQDYYYPTYEEEAPQHQGART